MAGRYRSRLRKWLGPLFSLGVFGGAVYVLFREAHRHPFHAILIEIHDRGLGIAALAGLLTAIVYWVLSAYDWLGFRFARYHIGYGRVTFAALLAFVFGNNIGMANFAAAAVRYRIYSAWRVPKKIITQVIALDILSNWLGFLFITSLVFLVNPPDISGYAHLPFHDARPLGIISFLILTGFFGFAFFRRRPIRIWEWKLPIPRNWVFFGQILIACADFGLSGIVLYILLPPGPALSYWDFLGIYLLGQTAGILSHVPGGLGVFEGIILLSLSTRYGGAALLGALFTYRAIFFILPLLIAMPVFAAFELKHRRKPGRSRLPSKRSRRSVRRAA